MVFTTVNLNIHTHQKSIADLLQEGTRLSAGKTAKTTKTHYPGVYIISRTKVYDIFKLGEAHGNGGLYDRIIHQYKICYSLKSSEFFLRYLVICPRKKEGKLHYSQIMEKEMLKIIDSKTSAVYGTPARYWQGAPAMDDPPQPAAAGGSCHFPSLKDGPKGPHFALAAVEENSVVEIPKLPSGAQDAIHAIT